MPKKAGSELSEPKKRAEKAPSAPRVSHRDKYLKNNQVKSSTYVSTPVDLCSVVLFATVFPALPGITNGSNRETQGG